MEEKIPEEEDGGEGSLKPKTSAVKEEELDDPTRPLPSINNCRSLYSNHFETDSLCDSFYVKRTRMKKRTVL